MRTLLFLFFFATLQAGDKWDYYIRTHADISWNETNRMFLTKVCERISKKFNLITHQSLPQMTPFKASKWCYSYISYEELTPEQAQVFVRKVFLETLAEIHRSPETLIYLTEDVDAKTISPSLIGLKISFFHKDKTRPQAPFISRIYVDQGHTFYNYSACDNQLDQAIALD